ncbi:MAG: mandelate racemase/muconate lactonizing enzyme family protein [Thermoguttaceae bacterium]
MHWDRRRFLAAAAATTLARPAVTLAAGAKSVKIDRIELFPVRYPTVAYFKFFEGPGGNYGRAAVIVKMTADDGTVGWGQSVPVARWSYETLDTATIAMRDYLAPTLIGLDPLDIAAAHDAMDRALAPGFTTGMPLSRAGLDLALHDLAGKLTGRSLAQMWNKPEGGTITLSWTVNVRTLDETESVVAAGKERGYEHFNIKVAPDPAFDVELARIVRRLVPNGFLWADGNGGYDVETALRAAPMLADVGVDVLESPIRPNRISGYQKLKRQAALPILMDEGVISPVELAEFIQLGMLDGMAMKPARCGGLFSNRRQIELVEAAGLVWLGSGLCDPDISLAACLALYGAYGLKKPAALNSPQFLGADVLAAPMPVVQGRMQVPTGPGLGVQVDEHKVRELVEKTASVRKRS